MTKHTGRNDTAALIYLVEVVTVRPNPRFRPGVVTFDARRRHAEILTTRGESYTDRAEALAAYEAERAASLTGWVSLKVKRPGSSAFVAPKAGE